jgi:hypothetical protein
VAHHRDDAPPPPELVIAQAVDEHGFQSVFGTGAILSARQFRDWRVALNVELYCSASEHAMLEDDTTAYWGAFLKRYPHADSVLAWANRQYKEFYNG